jgi:hypothetical protein
MNMSRALLVLILLTLNGPSLFGQEKSFADIAQEEEQRRQGVTQPAKVYTNESLSTGGVSPLNTTASCKQSTKYDSRSGHSYRIEHCDDGTTTEYGSNLRTGTKWINKRFPDGHNEGIDACGRHWKYDPATTVYVNDDGEFRIGEGEFRMRLSASADCKTTPAAAPSAERSDSWGCGPEGQTAARSGSGTAIQRCSDGTIREYGDAWQNTILPDGSQYGSNSCGVRWNYDARTDRYETSLGEKGQGKNVFRGNLSRISRCELYVIP